MLILIRQRGEATVAAAEVCKTQCSSTRMQPPAARANARAGP